MLAGASPRKNTENLTFIVAFVGGNRSIEPQMWHGTRESLCRLRVLAVSKRFAVRVGTRRVDDVSRFADFLSLAMP